MPIDSVVCCISREGTTGHWRVGASGGGEAACLRLWGGRQHHEGCVCVCAVPQGTTTRQRWLCAPGCFFDYTGQDCKRGGSESWVGRAASVIGGVLTSRKKVYGYGTANRATTTALNAAIRTGRRLKGQGPKGELRRGCGGGRLADGGTGHGGDHDRVCV